MTENDTSTLIELRSRNRGATSSNAFSSTFGQNSPFNMATTSSWSSGKEDDKVFIEHVVQPTDSLYKIGLVYSVPVGFIKVSRINLI
jgi:hypothetical protein